MNARERFHATMHYRPRDRSPICDFGFWEETIVLWHEQGLPSWVTYDHYDGTHTSRYFGMDALGGGPGVHVGMWPAFEEKVIEDRGDHELVQQSNGVIVLRKKFMGSIPEHHGHLLVDRASWEKHYQWRLDPDTPDRYPNWEEARKLWDDPQCSHPRSLGGGSLYGWLRDWMGLEAVSYLVYDDPALFEEMVVTIGDLVVEAHRRAFEHGGKFDVCCFWEDMCYNSGPLLPPNLFRKYLVPQYRRITDQCRAHGCDVSWVDCDGKIDELLPLWLEGGVNCMFPIEVGTWGADPVRYRKQYGRELLLVGGFDKRILARTKREIEREVHRLAPLVEEGGYIGLCDHRVPPDVPYANYLFYLETIRRIWGKGVNLKPIGQQETPKP